ncbi:MAG: diguanylate cyclase [Gammaproteobacteria bacterium]|nr:diguanylate cyclase [Gammaproteobacteria bacterium]
MSTVNETSRLGTDQDWKQRYRDLAREADQERATWAQSERALVQALLKFAQCFDGLDVGLDRQLSSLRTNLRSSSEPKIRAGLLGEIADACLAQARKRASLPTDSGRAPLETLLAALRLPAQTTIELRQIQSRLKNGEDPARVAALLANTLNDLAATVSARTGPSRGSAPADDIVPRVLDELATHDALRERAAGLRSAWQQDAGAAARQGLESRFLQLVRDALGPQDPAARTPPDAQPGTSLAQLLDWLLLPSEFEERSQRLRETLGCGASADPVRETGKFLNDLHAFMRKDLRTLEDYLKQASENLSVIDLELRYAVDHSRTAALHSCELSRGINAEMDEIDAAVQDERPPADLRALVERRVATIRATMSTFLHLQQHRQETYEQRIADLNQRLQSFERESTRLREDLEAEQARAHSDTLTGAPNRLAYEERAQIEVRRAWRHRSPLCLAMLDLDHFKRINDGFGHKAGDKLLRYTASIALKRIRATDLFARYGGEEFVTLLTDTRLEDALEVCEDLRRQIAGSNFHFKGSPVPVTVSIGVAELGEQESLATLFDRADQALYRAKRDGRNRVEVAR